MTDVHSPRSEQAPDDDPATPRTLEVASRRRAPKYRAFVGTGILVGLVLALILTFTRPETEYGYGAVFGYTALVLGFVGALLGGLVAIWLDRRS